MFEREKLSGLNFNDWFRSLKLVLKVEKKLYVIEQPIPPAPAASSTENGKRFMMLIMAIMWLLVLCSEELKSMFEKQAGVERFDLIQTFHACKHEEGKPVSTYVLKMKDYMEQLERLGLPKKAETPQVMMIKGGKIQKANKKSLKAKGKGKANGKGNDKHSYISKPKNPKHTAKEHPTKDDTCHHCKKVGHWKRNCPVFLAELLKKKKQVGTASSSVSKNNVHYFNAIPSNGIYEIDMHDLVPNNNSIFNVSTKRAKHNLDSTYLWHYRLAHISKKRIEKLQQEWLLRSTDDK
ncbi:zinc finger, CCHC-type containing protein [Tanacetum coccineum]